MSSILNLLLFAAVSTAKATAFDHPTLYGRGVRNTGGWPLAETSCPADTTDCGFQCCPNSLSCIATGSRDLAEACCPGPDDCTASLQKAPACADSSWSLWNSTDTSYDDGFFCCLPSHVGLNSGDCVATSEVSDPTETAKLLSGGSPAAPSSIRTTRKPDASTVTPTSGAGGMSLTASFKPTATSNSTVNATASPSASQTKSEGTGLKSVGAMLFVYFLPAVFAVVLM